VEAVGDGVTAVAVGDEVFGVVTASMHGLGPPSSGQRHGGSVG
jgi:NADPH:quinone reductase-like Zn-dependent oxidoreductase